MKTKTTKSTKYFATAKKEFSYETMSGKVTWPKGSRFEMYRGSFTKEGMTFATGPMYCGVTFGWEYFTVTAEETTKTTTFETTSKEVTPTTYWKF